jgi:ADP-ribosylglycohydrolase
MLFGLALGTPGMAVEFLKLPEIKARFWTEGILEPPTPATFTDDTLMTIALAEGLIAAGGDRSRKHAGRGPEFVSGISQSGQYSRAGKSLYPRHRNYERGEAWREAGDRCRGRGSAMRVAAVGYLYRIIARTERVAQAGPLITHRHRPPSRPLPRSIWSSWLWRVNRPLLT